MNRTISLKIKSEHDVERTIKFKFSLELFLKSDDIKSTHVTLHVNQRADDAPTFHSHNSTPVIIESKEFIRFCEDLLFIYKKITEAKSI